MNKGYDKRDRDRGGGGGGGGGDGAGGWAPSRDRERDRERERVRQARAHQMAHAHATDPEPLFSAPFRVKGSSDHMSQQIRVKLGDYRLAQTLLDDPSKSIGICAEPPSPAPCPPSRRESEFKKPSQAPQNGRIHHRPHSYNKGDGAGSTSSSSHRPPPLRIPNGIQQQTTIDSQSSLQIENILKEMKDLPTPLSSIAATPRKELDNNIIYNPFTNKVQQNPLLPSNDLKPNIAKPALDNLISNSVNSASPVHDVNKDLIVSESDDDVPTSQLEPILSPLGSGASPSSASESSQSDSESESSSAESTAAPPATEAANAPPPANAPDPAQRPSWGLKNFAPPLAPLTHLPDQNYEDKDALRHALAEVKGKPSPISELSDSEASSPSPGVTRRRSSKRVSTASSDEDTSSHNNSSPRVATPAGHTHSAAQPGASSTPIVASTAPVAQKRGRPPKQRVEDGPTKKKRGRPPKYKPPTASPHDSEPELDPPQHHPLQDTKTHIFRKLYTVNREGGGKGKGGKGKGGKGKGQVTIIEVCAPESGADDDDRRDRDRSTERRNEEALARVSPPQEPETVTRRREADRLAHDRIQEKISIERNDRIPERPIIERAPNDRISDRTSITNDRLSSDRLVLPPDRPDRIPTGRLSEKVERMSSDRIDRGHERLTDKGSIDRLEKVAHEKPSLKRSSGEKIERISNEKIERQSNEKLSEIKLERLSDIKLERLSEIKMERLSTDELERLSSDKLDRLEKVADRLPPKVERIVPERYVRAEADVGSGIKSERGSERLEEASSITERQVRTRVTVSVPLSRLSSECVRALRQRARAGRVPPPPPATPPAHQGVDPVGAQQSHGEGGPIYFSYFERLPVDTYSDDENHRSYMSEAKSLKVAAEREQDPLPRVMLYLESVLCFVLTGRVLELEQDTKRAFTIYRETIEYIKSIHSMPQSFRASPLSTFCKLDILSLRVQSLLYLRMFKMYNREVKEYYKIVQEYQQKPALPESVSPHSPTPSPAGSVGSVGSASSSSGYCSLVHSVPASAHHALLQLNKYYTFLYVAHDLWEQADSLCRSRAHQDLFISVDRKCGPLTLSSTFKHLVQYVRHAISLLKNVPRE